jgi:tetratricopeptide (TPR) repeat protein
MRRALLVAALAVTGCAGPDELSRRFEAERARWKADHRREAAAEPMAPRTRAALRLTYGAIEREFGAAERPGPDVLARPDARLRLEIAGRAALVRADLAASASKELAAEYARVAEIYGFAAELDQTARVGQARTLERLGDDVGALTVWDGFLAAHSKVPGAPETLELVDLELHANVLAGRAHGQKRARERRARVRAELAWLAEEWGEAPGRRSVERRLADAYLLDERWDEGLRVLAGLTADGGSPEEVAELELAQGTVHEVATRDLDRAEEHYRRALPGGDETMAAAEARLRLADLARRRGRPREGLAMADSLLIFGARVLEGREAEVLWVKAKCLVALTRWEDAIPAFARAARVDSESPFRIVAALERYERFRGLLRDVPAGAAEDFVAAAAAVSAGPAPPVVPLDWQQETRARDLRRVWRDGVDGLVQLADREGASDLGRAALAHAARLASDRAARPDQAESLRKKYENRFPDAGEIKQTAFADELSR